MGMMKKRVFMSFIEEDKQRIWGLRLLAANPDYDLDFYDESLKTPIDSFDAAYIKAKIRAKIERASVTVCLISEQTHASSWVDWELEESDQRRNAIIAMALKGVDEAILPKLIKQKGLPFHGWDPARLNGLIRDP
jgi:MTH538 TIR-like domain (DUF1863)